MSWLPHDLLVFTLLSGAASSLSALVAVVVLLAERRRIRAAHQAQLESMRKQAFLADGLRQALAALELLEAARGPFDLNGNSPVPVKAIVEIALSTGRVRGILKFNGISSG